MPGGVLMRKFENFKSEQELIGRIEQLRADGVSDDDITVFSKEGLEGTSLNYTNVNFKSADGTAWDKFVSFFTSEKPEERAMADLGLDEANREEYMTALQAGDILMFVSEEARSASEENLGNNEEDEANIQSDDDAVGGERHDAEYRREEDDPGLPGTDRAAAVSANTAPGSTLSSGENERSDVRDEEVDVDSRGISNKPGTNSDGRTREDKDVSDYGTNADDTTREDKEAAGYGTKASGSRVRIIEADAARADDDRTTEGPAHTDSGEKSDAVSNEEARVSEAAPEQTYDAGTAGKRYEDQEAAMVAGSGRTIQPDEGEDISDEDIERDARVVDEEPFEEYITKETGERVDVSTYGYDDTENRDDIETSSEDVKASQNKGLSRDDRAIRNKYKFEETKESDYTAHDPDRRNFNTK